MLRSRRKFSQKAPTRRNLSIPMAKGNNSHKKEVKKPKKDKTKIPPQRKSY